MKAPEPENEQQRLEKLQSLNILDTLPEETYDDITYLAAQLTETPISLITLVDTNRQWFKSRYGLDVTETHRDMAFCAHAIREPEELLIVPDATADDRFSDNPLVTGPPDIRFYAGAPLVCSDGSALGTLCVIDNEPKKITGLQAHSLRVLARQVVAQMELREALAQVKQLRGMLPMCAHCKKVRDDEGFWETVENYIHDHSDAMVTHGICPECMETEFPEIAAKLKKHPREESGPS